jgi:hypothetical protein
MGYSFKQRIPHYVISNFTFCIIIISFNEEIIPTSEIISLTCDGPEVGVIRILEGIPAAVQNVLAVHSSTHVRKRIGLSSMSN